MNAGPNATTFALPGGVSVLNPSGGLWLHRGLGEVRRGAGRVPVPDSSGLDRQQRASVHHRRLLSPRADRDGDLPDRAEGQVARRNLRSRARGPEDPTGARLTAPMSYGRV